MTSKYTIKKIPHDIAHKVWLKSPNSSVFNNPNFLEFFSGCEYFGAFKGEELYCCWPILPKNKKFVIPDFFYYFGPYWSYKFYDKPLHSRFSLTNDIYNSYIDLYIKKFLEIHFQLHYTLTDIRAFDWFNFNFLNC